MAIAKEVLTRIARSATAYVSFVPKLYGDSRWDDETGTTYDSPRQLTILYLQVTSCFDYKLWLDVGVSTESRVPMTKEDLIELIHAFVEVWGDVDHPNYYTETSLPFVPVSKPGDQEMSEFTYSPVGTFAYNQVGGTLKFVRLSLNDAAAWSVEISYLTGAVVQRGTTYWIALVSSQGIDPLTSGQLAWSPLVPTKMETTPTPVPVGFSPCQPPDHSHCPHPPFPHVCPPPFAGRLKITSFSVLPRTVLYGSTGATSFNFAWTLEGYPASQTIFPGDYRISATERAYTSTYNFLETTEFTLAVHGMAAGEYDTARVRVPLVSAFYYGVSDLESLTTSQVQGLSVEYVENSELSKSLSPDGGYIYLAYPSRLSGINVYVNGFYSTLWETSTVSLTNSSGFTETYTVLRSTYTQHGVNIPIEAKHVN